MDDEQRQQLKQRLLELKVEIMDTEASASEGRATVELDQSRVGRLSRMDAMQSQQMGLENQRRRQQQLLKMDGALKRLEAGEFGHCFICGADIDMRRLVADPTHTRCIDCVDTD